MNWYGEVENVGDTFFTGVVTDPQGVDWRSTLPKTLAPYTNWYLVKPGQRFVVAIGESMQEVKFFRPLTASHVPRPASLRACEPLPRLFLEQMVQQVRQSSAKNV